MTMLDYIWYSLGMFLEPFVMLFGMILILLGFDLGAE